MTRKAQGRKQTTCLNVSNNEINIPKERTQTLKDRDIPAYSLMMNIAFGFF